MKILELLKTLAETSGTNDKIALLKMYQNDYVTRSVFYLAYSPRYIYGIKKHPIQTPALDATEFEYEDDIDRLSVILHALHNREYTGNTAKRILSNFLTGYTEESQQLILNIINHDLRCGMNATNINKAFPAHIELAPPYQRCSLMAGGLFEEFGDEFYSQVKADGMFLNLYIGTKGIRALTRAGNEFPIVRFARFHGILEEYARKTQRNNWVTGEIVVFEDGVMMPREKSNGVANKILKEGDIDFERYQIKFFVWDIIPEDQFYNKGKYETPYNQRYSQVRALAMELDAPEYFEVIETMVVKSYDEAYTHYLECRSKGLEGTVIKAAHAPWIDGTSKYQIKMKAEVDIDMRIIDLKEGKGKNADTFGSILMSSECEQVQCHVSGISDELRKYIFDNFEEEFRGKIATVRSNSMTKARGSDVARLFLPRWIELRHDKDRADSLTRIEEMFKSKL